MSEPLKNWAGNLTYAAKEVLRPQTRVELQTAVKENRKVRALGSRHCFNDIADTPHTLISIENLSRVLEIDPIAKTVKVEGGITYGQLNPLLEAAGFALPNLASLPHISVAGATATATHGSGQKNQNLAASVVGLDFIDHHGEIVTVAEGTDEWFPGAVVHLGALGIVSSLTLRIEPTYQVRQDLYLKIPFEEALANFDAIQAMGSSVSFFTTWSSDTINQVWLKNRVSSGTELTLPSSLFGASPATVKMHPLDDMPPENTTDQLGIPGPWYNRLPHFRLEFTPSGGDELQSEYFVPREDAVAALRVISKFGDQIAPLLLVSEIRTIASDSQWLSPCYEQDSVAIHFTWKAMGTEVKALLPSLEAALAPFSARPHWGKIFTMAPEVIRSRYPKFDSFVALMNKHDAPGKFRNAFIERLIS